MSITLNIEELSIRPVRMIALGDDTVASVRHESNSQESRNNSFRSTKPIRKIAKRRNLFAEYKIYK